MLRALLFACALSMSAMACDGGLADPDLFRQPDLSGSLRIPLVRELEGGPTYALRDVTVELSGAAMLTLSARGSDEQLTSPLPSGNYTAFLRPGYRVVQIDADGSEHGVEATFIGPNPLRVQLNALRESTLKLGFAHEGRQVVFGERVLLQVTSAR